MSISDRIEAYKLKRERERHWNVVDNAAKLFDNEQDALQSIGNKPGYTYLVKWWAEEKEMIENLIIMAPKEDLHVLRQELDRAKRFLSFLVRFQSPSADPINPDVDHTDEVA